MTEEESNEFDEQFRCAECEGYSDDFYRWVEQKKKQWQEEAVAEIKQKERVCRFCGNLASEPHLMHTFQAE